MNLENPISCHCEIKLIITTNNRATNMSIIERNS